MTLAQSRKELAKALTTKLGRGFALFPNVVDNVTKPTLQLKRVRVEPLASAPRSGNRESTFQLALIAPEAATDDDLEGWLEQLLEAIDEQTDIIWAAAERGVWPQSPINAAYLVEFTRYTEKG